MKLFYKSCIVNKVVGVMCVVNGEFVLCLIL